MNKILIILLIGASFNSLGLSINPDREHYPLFKVYAKGKVLGLDIELPGLYFNGRTMKLGGKPVSIPLDIYNKVKAMADSTLTVNSSVADGSAVHVGENLLLTNLHVLSSDPKKVPRDCRAKFYSNAYSQAKKRVRCKKIHHCSVLLDYCLVEVVQGLQNSKAAKLKTFFKPDNAQDVEIFGVGNTADFGIYASSGFGYAPYGATNIKYYASSFSGNSGGGIFNNEGQLIGIVRAQSKLLYGERSFNVAIPLHVIRRDLLRTSQLSSEILNKLERITI